MAWTTDYPCRGSIATAGVRADAPDGEAEQIRDSGFNLDIKNPHDSGTTMGDPDKLLAEYQQLLAAVNVTREKLKRELQSALER